MKRIARLALIVLCPVFAFAKTTYRQRDIGKVGRNAHFLVFQSHGKWGLALAGTGMASANQPKPVSVELYQSPNTITKRSSGYDHIEIQSGKLLGTSTVPGLKGTSFLVNDRWEITGETLQLTRSVRVQGTADAGFMTSITFHHSSRVPRSSVDYFAPGMIYGSTNHLSPSAIGGGDTYGPSGNGDIQVREDRLPAPMFGVHFADGSGLTVLDAAPRGATTTEDSHDVSAKTLVDASYTFGALGVHLAGGLQEQGFLVPRHRRGNNLPRGYISRRPLASVAPSLSSDQ